jgi:hypothetical protein
MLNNRPLFTLPKTAFLIQGTCPSEDNDQSEQCRLFVDNQEVSLTDSLKIRNHSPDGFNWGYGGSGPAQSALAICLHIFQNQYVAEALYQSFKAEFVARWQPQLTSFEVMIDITDFLIEHRDALKQAGEQQVWEDESAGWSLVEEAERLINPAPEPEIVQPVKHELVSRYQVGDVVRTRAAFLGSPAGSRAVVYELYAGGGIQIISETGNDLGGFSLQDQGRYLEFLYYADGFDYTFQSVHRLQVDWQRGTFLGVFR